MPQDYELKTLHFWTDIKSPSPPHYYNELLLLASLVHPKLVIDYRFVIENVADAIKTRLDEKQYDGSREAAEAAVNAAENYMYNNYNTLSLNTIAASYRDLGGDRHEGGTFMTFGASQDALEWDFILAKAYKVNPIFVISVQPA